MRLLNALATTFLLLSCAHEGPNQRADQGRGTEACRIWQDAICDHFADECNVVDRKQCDRQYQSVTCRSDDIADRCADMLKSADCGEARQDCLIDGVANPEPAQAACDSLVDTYCERSTACGVSDNKEKCKTTSSMLAQCGKAVGYQLSYESCLEEIPNIDCSVLQLPEPCSDVIVARR
jgi:hypothetical protein